MRDCGLVVLACTALLLLWKPPELFSSSTLSEKYFSSWENEEEGAQPMFCSRPAGLMWPKLNKACSITVLKSHWFTKCGPPQKMFAKYKFVTSLLYQHAQHHNKLKFLTSFLTHKNLQKKSIRLQYVNIDSQASCTQAVDGCSCGLKRRCSHKIAQEPRKLFSLVVITPAPLLRPARKEMFTVQVTCFNHKRKIPSSIALDFPKIHKHQV